VDSGSVGFKVSEASGTGFDGSEAAVESFAGGIADHVPEPGKDVGQSRLQRAGHLLHRFPSRTDGTRIDGLRLRVVEERVVGVRLRTGPEPAEVILESAGPGRLQRLIPQRGHFAVLRVVHVLRMMQPQLARAVLGR
jgi:hypothetical protein